MSFVDIEETTVPSVTVPFGPSEGVSSSSPPLGVGSIRSFPLFLGCPVGHSVGGTGPVQRRLGPGFRGHRSGSLRDLLSPTGRLHPVVTPPPPSSPPPGRLLLLCFCRLLGFYSLTPHGLSRSSARRRLSLSSIPTGPRDDSGAGQTEDPWEPVEMRSVSEALGLFGPRY